MAPAPEPLLIKKYPNRRFYDATRSCHITLQDVYDQVVGGRDVLIIDSRTDEDITNVVLLQIVLEKDHPKLNVFPSSVMHLMLRSNHQVIRQSLERFFGPFMAILAQSQKQFDEYLRQTMRGPLAMPMSWASNMMQAFSPSRQESRSDAPVGEPNWEPEPSPEDSLDGLRAQIEALNRRVEQMSRARNDRRTEESGAETKE